MLNRTEEYIIDWLEDKGLKITNSFSNEEVKSLLIFIEQYNKRKESKEWVQYVNGNYLVEINKNNGTKIRTAPSNSYEAEFPENIDIKITNWCDMGCAFCHENSNIEGKHANLFTDQIQRLLNSLRLGTELALGGGKVTSHPHLEELLHSLKRRGIFANITIHQKEYSHNWEKIQRWIKEDLVKGVGISWSRDHEFQIDSEYAATKYDNVVLHTIAGITTLDDYKYISESTKGKAKVLILGYKDFRRGSKYKEAFNDRIENNIKELKEGLPELFNLFSVVSFDNLALNQLNPKSLLTEKQWETYYQGQDSNHTMYIDLVTMTYAGHSTTPENERFNLLESSLNIKDIFKQIKGTVKEGL